MDHIFEGDMLDEINQLFLPNMRNKLMWFYQEMDEPEPQPSSDAPKAGPSRAGMSNISKTPQGTTSSGPTMRFKLFLTDGWNCAFTGVCIYMFRINNTKQLPEEGFHKDLYCGVIDSRRVGLVASVERIVEYIFMQALGFPTEDDEEINQLLIKGQLLPGLRSFCSALRVCEKVCNYVNVFEDNIHNFSMQTTVTEVKELATNQEFCRNSEERVKAWMKGINVNILMESEQPRRENDSSGPQDELEYWKCRGAQFSQLLSHLQEKEVQYTLTTLSLSGSKVMKMWKETDRKITFCYNEARDNSKFIQSMEQCCHALYLDDPVNMKESILSLLQTVRLIYSVSQFYNTSERTSALMVKITNQMIETCKSYITCRGKETIWSQDRNLIRTKLTNCIKLNHIYRETYYTVRAQPFLPNQTPFGFSENLYLANSIRSKIISMFNLIDDYNHLFERRLEGLLLGEALDEAMNNFGESKKEVVFKKYDYLDHRNAEFNVDFQSFLSRTNTLKESIASMIEYNFDTVWETPQGIRFLIRFEKVSEKIPLTQMEEKYQRILKYCEKEVERILKLFRKQRDDPPLPRNVPPIAGRIKWCRSLECHLAELVSSVSTHPILQNLPATKDLENRYNSVKIILAEYEQEIVSIWLNQDVTVADACLVQPILALQHDRLFVNLHSTIPLLIREAKCLAKMNIELPIVAATLLAKQNHFSTIQDSLNSLIKMFLSAVKKVKLEVRPLFLPQLVRLTSMLRPGLQSINWTDPKWVEFYENCKEAITTFDILVARVHDIYANRILHVLMSMQDVTLQTLPTDDEMWTIEEFLEKNEEACRQAAIELNRKSQMVSEAVEEVLELVQKASQQFKEMCGAENDLMADEESKSTPSSNKDDEADSSQNQQQDWSILWSCFENPLSLLSSQNGGLSKGMQDMVHNAVAEMRRYYSRKVIDVLIRVTRSSLDMLRRRFVSELDGETSRKPVFLMNATLMIPNVSIRPTLDELQETLVQAGKNIAGVAKGVAQWSSGKDSSGGYSITDKRMSRNIREDSKTRRRKVYRLVSEEKPQMPHMTKSFYSYIMDNKEVVKTLSLLSTCTRNVKQDIQGFIKRWKPYHFLWKNDRTARQLMEYGLHEFESSLRCLADLDANLLIEPDMEYFGQSIAISTEKLKYGLAIEIKSCTHKIGQAMKKKYKREMDYVYAVMHEMERKLDRQIRDLDDVRMIMDTLAKIREQEVDMELRIDPIEEAFNVLTKYEVQVDREHYDQVDNLRYTWQNLQGLALQAQVKLLDMQPSFESDLRNNLDKFRQDKIEYVNEYRNAGPMQPGLTPREASDKLILFQNRFDGMWRRLQTYQSGKELFGLPQTDYPELGQIRKELNLLQKLYKLYNDVIDRVSSYYDIPWGEVDIEEINNELMEFQNRCRKLPKGLKEWPAFHALKRTIDDFNDMCPLLELMANKAMKPRHWQRIMEVTKYTFEFDSEGFSLKNILEAPLLKYKEDIEDICISAMKEKDIEAKLKQVTNEWSVHELQFMTFNNRGELLLRGDTTAETIGQLEDSLMVLGSLMSNRYNAPFRKQIQQWVFDLSNSNDILERWLLVQNMWVYLEAVFVGGDIAKQLPKEAKRFSKIDKSWQKIMQRAHETPGVVACCVGDDLLKQLLPHLQEQLELCQKSLSGYLERKRMMFPRFFFVSDPALLEILGQASDSHTIQNHLLSIFDNTRFVKFHDIEYNKMMAIVSSEGETIQLDRAIRAEGSVETWLTSLLVSSQQSLHSIIRQAHTNINDPNFQFLSFLEKMPAQVGILGIQMVWTRDAELALMQARHEKKDEPLFISLVADLFPNQMLEKTTYPDLEAAIQIQVEEAGLIFHPPWVLKLIQLYETQKVRHGIMTLGPAGAGKTSCIQILMKALSHTGECHREMRMNPKAITAAQMFVLMAWLLTRSPREKAVFQELFELSFAALYAWGTQNLNLMMDVLQCNIVSQMLSILEGLVPVLKEEENNVALSTTESLEEENPEEQKTEVKDEVCTPEHLHRLYIFAMAWGMGAFLNTGDQKKMDEFVKQRFPTMDFPIEERNPSATIFDFFVTSTGAWQNWSTLVTNYVYPEYSTPDYLSILVPIVDNVRIDYLISTIANQEKAVLLIGEQGTAKTVMMKNFMKKTNPESFMGRSFNFSSATSPFQFQKTIESYVEKRLGNTFGPPGGRKLIVFIDDINLPQINEWGDQITNEIVRQTMDMKGFYSLEKPRDFTNIVDVQFVAAMGLPGGGRNDIPSRLKRQFAVFNCNIPDDASIDKIFRVVGEGHYNTKRGFQPEVRNLVKRLIPLTRLLWQHTRNKLLPTPAKFHYVFSLRDLSRIWQGMIGTLSTVITSESVMVSLWKHECTRVFSDRFTVACDKEWFNTEILALVTTELGEEFVEMAKPNPVFVDFMRDAPEPTGEEGEDTDMELPKVYEPVTQYDILRERLIMFLSQFNEMVRGTGMDLVFFPDAMLHLVKISRIIRHPRGNVMLVGVGGSGKQSLTKLASFIAGYKIFQINMTRSYNVANFLEDLKLLYRSCGVQGKGTTFLFSDLDIKEEGFLEYLNNILSSGVISNLFNRDEQSEIVSELTPIMKRENQKKTATSETVMEYFLQRTCHNLHVVFCFSPVGETFRHRVLRFPALVSGCTIDWFQPWPKDALVSVAKHFLSDFEIECTKEVKVELVNALGTIQDVVSETSVDYFQRFRRATHVTPKSYLNFIAGYKNIYQQKQKELGDGVEKMDTGLEKLAEASASVEILKKDLAVMEKELAEASQKAERVLLEVTERAMQAEIVKNQVQTVKEKAEALVANIAEEKGLAEEKLEAAKPALEEAEAALNTIKPAHIATVRKLGRPPHLIMRIMDCKVHPMIADTAAPCPKPSWQESLKMMASTTFLLQLQNYPKDTINDEMIDFLQPYFRMEDYNMDTARRVCGDVAGLLSWTKAMAFFHGVNKEVLPLKANLTLQEARLKIAMDDLAAAENQLAEREAALQEVKEQYDSAVAEKQRLTDAANVCLRKMTAATALINGLGGEKHRWTQQSKEFKIQLGKLVGDVLLATGFLSYCGPYNQEFRANLLKTWMSILKTRNIPYTHNLNIINMLVESSTVSEWTLQGLPNDELSVQNALIVTKSSSYPLLCDPQNQGKLWIKTKEDCNELQITSLNHKYFRTHLEDSLSLGRPLLIEDVGVELDPVIDNVLEKNFIKSGTIEKVLVGDKECDVMPGFMLYITTKLPNPAFSPEISAKTSIIDFTVTMRGLEDQLLGRVILMEKSDLEAERVNLFESVMKNQRSMKELEANLLSRLTSSEGSLVDDEALIQVLQETKTTAEEVNQKLKISEVTEKKIMVAREEFRAVASRGSILYFLIVEMSNVNIMYQNSLKQFLHNGGENNIILKYLTYEVWAFTSRSLYERHKQLFTLMLAIKIDYHKGNISHEEFMSFVKGGASLDLNAVQPKPFRWILDMVWLNLVEISRLNTFSDLLKKIETNEKEWRVWYEAEKPEMEEIPCGYHNNLDVFRKLLLVRSWSPDRTISQARKYIEESLGPEYGEMQILDLEATWEESEPRTPLICILSIGSDPSTQISTLAKIKSIPLKAVSMGQGQEFHARKLITDCMGSGGWVLLQNAHLSITFCAEIIDILVETEHVEETFRLWVTTEVHEQFPIGLLQMAIKFTNEPPQGIRASMKRSYQTFTQDFLDYTSAPQWPPLLYTIAFLHTVVQERRKFGPLGWNVPYEFNQADFAASVQFIQNHLDEMDPKKGVSWQTLCYMLGEVQYGAGLRMTLIKRLLTTFTQVWFSESLLSSGFEFYKGYRVPMTRNLQGYVDYINSLPTSDTPEVFGLHPNADITYQINTAKGILDTILSVQPKEGGSQGGETRENIVYQLADDMLRKLPPAYNSFEVKEALLRMGVLLPMNIFLRQEIDRMQRVIKTVRSSLSDLKLAIDGTIVMSQYLRESLDAINTQFRHWCNSDRPKVFWMTGFFNPQGFLTAMRQRVIKTVRSSLSDLKLAIDGTIVMSQYLRESLDAMYDARIPDKWMKVSWESTTLGFWYTELLERNTQFRHWCNSDRPKVFWMTGFFNPQGFLTAMRQEVTRAHKGWALDSVVLQNQITRFNKEDISEAPSEGVYVHGLFLEGASLDRRSGKLIESKPKVLYEQMPVTYIYAINTTAGKDPRLYECPIYRKPQRTDQKYVGSIDFETDFNSRHWILRGVALLCDIK
uniref:Putative dyneins heavy chain n=1 Tax=Lutzomyia longipalpis TaxID=7200 RepID=A0A1B0GJY1_LUTLO